MTLRLTLVLLCSLLLAGTGRAGTSTSDLNSVLPPVILDTTKAADCTVTYLVTDVTTNDMFAARMQIAPEQNERPVNGVMPCPAQIPPRVASRALDVCTIRAVDPGNCVFADMARGFEIQPRVDNTAENNARCASDKASDIGVACWRAGDLQICDVGCGNSAAAAITAAVGRCEARQQRQCPITGSLPVLAPK